MTLVGAPADPGGGVLAASLHRPFLDLRPSLDGPLFSQAPVLAYAGLEREATSPGMQRVLSTNFRVNLLKQTGLHGYALVQPDEMEEGARTPEWSRFCHLLRRFGSDPQTMATPTGVRLAQLCLYLGFHRHLARLLPSIPATACAASPLMATLAYQRAFARRMLHQEELAGYVPSDMEMVAVSAPAHSRIGFYAASAMVVHHAKVTRDGRAAGTFRRAMDHYVEFLARRPDTAEAQLDRSRYWRCVSFVPFLEGDAPVVTQELESAEVLARDLVARSESGSEMHLVALDNLHAVLESRMREALWVGDVPLARARITEVATFDPLDAKVQIELGEVHMRAGDLDQAVQAFATAARCGPPGTAVAHYLAGCCYQQMDMPGEALDEFLAAAALDPWSTSTAHRLRTVAERVGVRPMACWAEQWADRLGRGPSS
ncbi:MAG: tetratricopeptide repeat protein [Acidimicrobiia bacterium]